MPDPMNKVGEDTKIFLQACLSIVWHSAVALTIFFFNHTS